MSLSLPVDPGKLEEAAEEFGTPVYVTDSETIRDRYSEMSDAFPDARIQYAAKANTNPRILEVLRDEGAAVDAVSLGEVVAAEKAGFEPDEIMYTGVNPPEEELRRVIEKDVRLNADSVSGIERIAEIDPGREIGIRVNPSVGAGHHEKVITGGEGSKFGVPEEAIVEAYERADEVGLEAVGVHMHIGSGVTQREPFEKAAEKMGEIVGRIEDAGYKMEYIDVGGGIGVPYRPGDDRPDLSGIADGIREGLGTESRDTELIVEPGRFLVAESTVLLTRVNTVKDGFVGVDAGFNTLLRPAMYDAYHHITNLSRDAPERKVDVVGPICETGDVLGEDRRIADPREGDVLAIHTAGAYGFSMSSRYNSRRLPAEVMVSNGGLELIRQRETFDDVFGKVVE
ncbi:diaminopimelate decarboxylase [Halorutilales archaeon Cl-col2-1]